MSNAWRFVASVLAACSVGLLIASDRHRDIASTVLRDVPAIRGNLVFNTHTAILMREHGVRRIYTRDRDFHRFPLIEVIDPLNRS